MSGIFEVYADAKGEQRFRLRAPLFNLAIHLEGRPRNLISVWGRAFNLKDDWTQPIIT